MAFKELCVLVCIVSALAQIRTPPLSRSGSASSQTSLAASGGSVNLVPVSEQMQRLGSLGRSASSFTLPNGGGGRLGIERLQPRFDGNVAPLPQPALQNAEASIAGQVANRETLVIGARLGIDRLQPRFDGNAAQLPPAMQNFEANRVGAAAPPLLLRQVCVHCYISHYSHSVCLFVCLK